MRHGVVLPAAGVARIDGLHAAVEAQDKIVEVEAQAQSVGHGYLLVEAVEAELSAGLVGVVARVPHVAGVDESRPVELPEEVRAIFHAHVQLEVARLVDEVYLAVLALVAARAQLAHAPAAHAVGAAGEVALFIGNDGGVAVRDGDARGQMQRDGIAVVDDETLGVVDVELGVLRIGYVEERIVAVLVLSRVQQAREAVEQVAGQFHAGPDLVAVGLVEPVGRVRFYGVVRKLIARACDEKILVTVAQHGVVRIVSLKVLFAKSVRYPRHEYIVEAEKVKAVLPARVAVGRPAVGPCAGEQAAVKFRPVLRVVHERHLRGRLEALLRVYAHQRREQGGEAQTRLHARLHVVLVAVALQACYGLVGASQLEREAFRAAEYVSVGVAHHDRHA